MSQTPYSPVSNVEQTPAHDPVRSVDPEPNANLGRLGVWTLSALVVANMIGIGVFTSSGFSLGTLGNPHRVMLAWYLCGLWAICGAIGYGALVKRLPESGGEYLFLSRFCFIPQLASLPVGFR